MVRQRFGSGAIRRFGRVILVLAASLLMLAAVAPPEQSATSTGGMWLHGKVGSGSDFPGWSVDPDYGGLMTFRVDLVDPGTVLTGQGPTAPDEADLRQPWISIVEEHANPPEGGGSEGWLRDVEELCSTWINPTTLTKEIDRVNDRIRVSADVPCDDGRGYDFYRVTWEGEIDQQGSLLPDAGWLWGSTRGGWQGHIEVVKAKDRLTPYTEDAVTQYLDVTMRICGHPGTETDCIDGWIDYGRLNAATIATTANRDD